MMNRLSVLGLALAASVSLMTTARAQGSDDCTTAATIAGIGSFAFGNANATDGAQQSSACALAHSDVWFKWTAAATQTMTLETCDGSSNDTVIAVYAGAACPASGTQLACSDDACGTQSSVAFNAVNGSTYLIQIGAWSANAAITGTFTLAPSISACGSSVGPDVITSDITSIFNASAANGLDAFTLGMTSTNIGSALVSWQGPNPLHPVLCEAAYKYELVNGAGRFEMVGIGWLKHGFASDALSGFCSCQDPGNIQFLGLGCSDPYNASQAATQSGLAPRWQVNPHTGVFPYPGASPPWSGTTARRIEIPLAELEPSSATTRYFGECMYVTQDDAQAGNGNNNASWKELTVTGTASNYTFATTGAVHPMQPAIAAWPVVEPGVKLASVQIPGDGLITVGSHATHLGGGVYHYEFAVHNLNADRAIGSFSVPLPPGANPTNVGFHDYTYRNGDGQGGVNQSATDWPANVAAGAITWACETQAQNANANAIRWQGTYNFRFDLAQPPRNGHVTFGLWKPGVPASLLISAEVPGFGPPPAALCFGDGSGSACPCANHSTVGANVGCSNSLASGGGLFSSGNPSLAADNFVLHGSGMPNGGALYFQGTTTIGGGAGTAFGDGLFCVGGTITRLYVKINVAGASQGPHAGDGSISILGANVAGASRVYQCWYRDSAAFCQAETFNLTSALQVTWLP
jgi:hypothetical protein